jgi:hypothetical protein
MMSVSGNKSQSQQHRVLASKMLESDTIGWRREGGMLFWMQLLAYRISATACAAEVLNRDDSIAPAGARGGGGLRHSPLAG